MKPFLSLALLAWLANAGALAAETNADPVPSALPAVSKTDLARGQQVVLQKCTDCHSLKVVFQAHYDHDGWNDAVTRMIGQGMEISDGERWAAIQYLAHENPPHTVNQKIGKLHFALVHFPIALILAVGFLDSIALARTRRLAENHVGLLLWMTALATTAAMLTGLRRVDPWATVAPLLEWHETAGFATFVLILSAAVLRHLYHRNKTRGRLIVYVVALVAASAVTLVTGHLGGTVVHG